MLNFFCPVGGVGLQVFVLIEDFFSNLSSWLCSNLKKRRPLLSKDILSIVKGREKKKMQEHSQMFRNSQIFVAFCVKSLDY